MTHPTTTFLVPVDFSQQAVLGLRQAKALAAGMPARIVALHVARENMPPWNMVEGAERERFVEKTLAMLRHSALEAGLDADTVEPRLRFGKLCDTILEQAAETQADCIVMGTSAGASIKKKIIGSNALRIVSEATVPVVTVKAGCVADKIDNVVLFLDLAKETREKVPLAVRLAQRLGATVRVVSFYMTDDEYVVNNLTRQAKVVESFVAERGVPCTTHLRKIDVLATRDAAMEAMAEFPGLPMVTTYLRPDIIDFLLGSFASTVVHSAPGPALTIAPSGIVKYWAQMPGIR